MVPFRVPSRSQARWTRRRIEANYAHGVLAIQMPKRAEAKPKQIKVNATKALKAA